MGARAVGVHDVNLASALQRVVTCGYEADPLPIGRQFWKIAASGTVRKLARVRTVGIHDKDLKVAAHLRIIGNLFAIGRPIRMVGNGGALSELPYVTTVGVH